jgi:hypothetical protein
MTGYDAVVIGIAGLILALPLGLSLLCAVRSIVFLFRAIRSPSWRHRPWSVWKLMSVPTPWDAAFFNKPPQLTRGQSLIIWAASVVVAICSAWALYYHLP